MKTITAQASNYAKTGTIPSKRKDIDRGVFRDMPLSTIYYGVITQTWARYSTDILAVLLFGSWGVYFWVRLGV